MAIVVWTARKSSNSFCAVRVSLCRNIMIQQTCNILLLFHFDWLLHDCSDSYHLGLCRIELQVVLNKPILNCRSMILDFLDIDSTISARPSLRSRFVSSANCWCCRPAFRIRSPTVNEYTVNSTGHITVRCGTSELRRDVVDDWLPIYMNCIRPVRYDLIHESPNSSRRSKTIQYQIS